MTPERFALQVLQPLKKEITVTLKMATCVKALDIDTDQTVPELIKLICKEFNIQSERPLVLSHQLAVVLDLRVLRPHSQVELIEIPS